MKTLTKSRPRDYISLRPLGPPEFMDLAKLRLEHPGGAPTLQPTHWVGAYDALRLVAAVGWIELQSDLRIVVEVDKAPDHWGKVGVYTLVRAIIASGKRHGIRVQALVLPGNGKLKTALEREGASCVLELWEVVD